MSKKKSKLQALKQKLASLRPNRKTSIILGLLIMAAVAVAAVKAKKGAISEGCYVTDTVPAVVLGLNSERKMVALVLTPSGAFRPVVIDLDKFRAHNAKRVKCTALLN
jgi:hypothetical protein